MFSLLISDNASLSPSLLSIAPFPNQKSSLIGWAATWFRPVSVESDFSGSVVGERTRARSSMHKGILISFAGLARNNNSNGAALSTRLNVIEPTLLFRCEFSSMAYLRVQGWFIIHCRLAAQFHEFFRSFATHGNSTLRWRLSDWVANHLRCR